MMTATEPRQRAALLSPKTVQADIPKAAFTATTADQSEIVAAMPQTAQELVRAVGFLAALDIMRRFGGDRLFIPANMPEADHPLVVSLGADVVSKLMTVIGAGQIEVPILASVERFLRDRALRADFDAGASLRELRQRYHLTQRHIRKILVAGISVSPREPIRMRNDVHTQDWIDNQYGATA